MVFDDPEHPHDEQRSLLASSALVSRPEASARPTNIADRNEQAYDLRPEYDLF
jgi:hypothetical protein